MPVIANPIHISDWNLRGNRTTTEQTAICLDSLLAGSQCDRTYDAENSGKHCQRPEDTVRFERHSVTVLLPGFLIRLSSNRGTTLVFQ